MGPIRPLFLLFAASALLTGCASLYYDKVDSAPAVQAQTEIPEEQLLDVGIEIFDPGTITEEDKEEGVYLDIRKAESRFIPVQLKNTLQKTGQWGAVRVIPTETDAVDVYVTGEIISSNGEELILKVTARDASGHTWLQKTYAAEADGQAFSGLEKGHQDAFQDTYNTIANDLLELKSRLEPTRIRDIRRVSQLKFAQGLAPIAFPDYLSEQEDGRYQINRLPADGDPMMDRVLKVREREYMFIDILNEYYADFYDEMWEPYENWRKFNQEEVAALRKVRSSSRWRKVLGAAAVAGAIAMEVMGASAPLLAIGGIYSYKTGLDKDEDAQIHVEAIRELGGSFDAEVQPMVVEVEGQTLKLEGTAEEQYKKWRALLDDIYRTETGFDTGARADADIVIRRTEESIDDTPQPVPQ